jgi:hypothetical protein
MKKGHRLLFRSCRHRRARQGGSKKLPVPFFPGLVFLLLLAGCPEEPPPTIAPLPPQSVARLVSLEGTVALKHGAEPAKPAGPGALYENDELSTGAASKALVRAPGGREIELGENTQFKVGKTLGEVEVSEGTISFLAADEGDAGTTRVTTKFGRTEVQPGARATLALQNGGLSVDVEVGVIEQLGTDGGTQKASTGQKLEVEVGGIEVTNPEPSVPDAGPSLDVQLLTEAGRVLVKAKGEPRFNAAKKTQGVAAGTAFQVQANSRARISGPGFNVRLPAGTNGTVTATGLGEDGNELAMDLSGPAQVALDGKAPAAITLGGKTPLTLKGKKEAAVLTGKGRLEVLMGEVELVMNGKTQTVKAGEVAQTGPKGVEVAARPKPLLLLPMSKRVKVYANRLGEVGLLLPDEAEHTQVASDPSFADVTLQGPGKELIAMQPPVQGELHWRTVDEKGEAVQTGHARFLPDKGGGLDETSRGDVVTETGLKATVYFQGAVPTLTFNFKPAEGARGYVFRIFHAGDLKKAVVERKVTENKLTLEPGILTEGSYIWNASPYDAFGTEKGGPYNKMDIIYDNSLTTLVLTSPHEGDRAEGAKAAGTAPLGSRLFINGKPAPMDASGRFSLPLPKTETVVFKLLSADGSESYWLRHLRR